MKHKASRLSSYYCPTRKPCLTICLYNPFKKKKKDFYVKELMRRTAASVKMSTSGHSV